MSRNRTKTVLITAIIALFAAAIAWSVAHEGDDDWADRAGHTVMQSKFVRHPLAKGLCVMVTRGGSIAQVDCPVVEHLLINPTPPGLPELDTE